MQKKKRSVDSVGGPIIHVLKRRWLLFLTACFIILFPSQLVLAEATDMQTIYHVYMGDKHIGAVSDKEVVKDIIDAKIEDNKDEYSHLSLTAGDDIYYIKEKSFHPELNEHEVKEKIKKDVDVKAKAQALKIDDEIVGYFKNKKVTSKLLNAYKAEYVDEKVLDKLDKQNQHSDTHEIDRQDKKESLEPGDSSVTNVSFSKDVSISSETVSPDTVMTKKKGLKLLEKGTLEEEIHQVEEGDVLESIADDYDLSMKEILDLNEDLDDEDSLLSLGQKIHVTAYQPYMDVLVEKEQMTEEKMPFKEKIDETDDLYKGEEEVTQEGSDGKEEVQYTIQEKNGKQVDKEATNHKVVKKPKKKIVRKGTKVIPSRGTGDLSWPVDGGHISSYMGSRWGKMHKGIDIAGPNSKTITAADNGDVVEAGSAGGYGNKIVINHNNGMKTVYAHLSSIDVEVGQTVEQGHSIGVMGSTGHSTGLHLHFEVHEDGSLKDPTEYVQQ